MTHMDTPHDPLTFTGAAALAAWLAAAGVPIAEWGQGGAKTLADLWAEVACGESVLRDGPPRREVEVVQVLIRRGDLMLMEIAQELADGRRRSRNLPPSEKFKVGERARDAARRCLHEELGVLCRYDGLREEGDAFSRAVDSPSYPGLPTRYIVHTVAAINDTLRPALPAADFWRDHDAPGDPIRRHLWGWRAAAV